MATTTAPVMAQTTTYSMNPNPQTISCLQRSYPCSIYVMMLACMIIFTGVVNMGMGISQGRTLPESFYESFPETRTSGRNQMIAGIVILIIGIILMMVCIFWCRYIKRNFELTPATYFSRTAMTTAVASNTTSASGIVQPPSTGGQPNVYLYQPLQQAGSIQQVQPAANQYQPVQPAINPTVHPVAEPSAPDLLPDQPPPSYNELMQPTTTKSYGNV